MIVTDWGISRRSDGNRLTELTFAPKSLFSAVAVICTGSKVFGSLAPVPDAAALVSDTTRTGACVAACWARAAGAETRPSRARATGRLLQCIVVLSLVHR